MSGGWSIRGIIGLNAYVTTIRTRSCSTSYKNIRLSGLFTVSQGTVIAYVNRLGTAPSDQYQPKYYVHVRSSPYAGQS